MSDQLAEAGQKFRASRDFLEQDRRALVALIRDAHEAGMPIAQIAERAGVSRPTVYKALRHSK